jgi:adhesin transport system outer membrane protein
MLSSSANLKLSIVLFPVLAFGATQATAQSASALRDSVERAVVLNPEVKLRYRNLEAANQEQKVAKGGWMPRIDLEATTGQQKLIGPSSGDSGWFNHSTATIQLRQTIFDGYATASDVRRLGYTWQAAYYELLSATDQTAQEAARAHIDVLRYRQLLILARENFVTHADVHARLTQRVNAGVGRRVDLEQSSGRLALAESNWLTEASNLHDVTARYQRLVGLAPVADLAKLPVLDQFLPTRDNLLLDAIRNNPTFLGAVATVRANRADAELRKASKWPTLELRASQSYERNQNGVSGDYRDSAIQLVLNYNLYRGGSDTARVRQYAEKLNAAFDLRDKACRDIRQTAQIATNDVNKLTAQQGYLAQHELSTSKARDAYRQQFDIGQRSLLDLLDTENELYEARRAQVNADNDLQLAKIRVLVNGGKFLGALQLRSSQVDLPESTGGSEVADDELLCSTELPQQLALDKESLPKPDLTPIKVSTAPVAVAMPVKPVAAPTPTADCKMLSQSTDLWINAWNRKDVATYLSAYSEAFVPALGMSRPAWEKLRKKRLTQPGPIQTTMKDLQTARCDGKTADVSFTQEFGSDNYRDVVQKTLSFEQVNGTWKITREAVTKGRTF